MSVVIPTMESFLYWYNQRETGKCTHRYASQMCGFHQTTWSKLCRDYRNGEDISKYFRRFENKYGRRN